MAGLNAQGLGVTVFNLHHADARGFEGMHMYTHVYSKTLYIAHIVF